MTAQPKPNDPSMEDILASIRRIIADDQAKAAKPQPEPPAEDVLDLTQSLRAAPAPEPAGFDQNDVDLMFREDAPDVLDGQDAIDNLFDAVDALEAQLPPPSQFVPDPVVEAHDLPLIAAPPPMRQPEPEPTHLLSGNAQSAVSGSFAQLAHTVLSQNARTLDDLVQEMLRPMLKGWLDENLPALVERLVKAEIERVARGGR